MRRVSDEVLGGSDGDGGGWMEGKAAEIRTMRSASALRFSKGCSSLNLDRILNDCEMLVLVLWICSWGLRDVEE